MVRKLFILLLLVGSVLACAQSVATPDPTPTPSPVHTPTFTPTQSPTFRPTPTLILEPATTPTATSTPTIAGNLTPNTGALPPPTAFSEVELQGLTHTGVKAAIEDLQRREGGDLSLIQVVRAEQVTWRDASLGCPEPGKFYAQVLTPGIWLILSYQGQEADYRIADSRSRLCIQEQGAEPLERRPLEGVWSRLASVSTPRSEVAATELNGKIYVFGGFGPGAIANEEYDPLANTWRQRAPIPRGVDHAATVHVGGKIYLIGGFDGRFRPVNTVWAYNPGANTWTRKADLPTPRGALGAAAVDGKIYAIGGVGIEGDVGTTEEYDPASDSWRPRSPMPSPRDHIAIFICN